MAEEKNKSDGNGIFLPYDQFGRLCYALAHAKTTMYDNEHTVYDIIRILAAGGDIGSTPVLSINGQTGDVEITAEDINCSAKDTSNSTVTFESGDSKTDKTYTDIDVLSSKEKHSTLFNKISIMIKNIRYIWSLIGNTNISSISDGTIRGAIYKLNDECMKKEVYKSNCDFNELIEPGFYTLYNPTANSPNSSIDYYSVEVINTKSGGSGGRHLVQIAISKDSYEIYIRYLSGYNYNSSTGHNEDTWLEWRSILGEITVDSALSSTSTNPVQNKVITTALNGKAASSHGNHVPAIETANNAKFLRNDNTWQTVTPANIGAAASSHTHSAYVNQNAFSSVVVGNVTIAADSATDTLTLVPGSNVTITADTTNDKITITSSHPTISTSTDSTSTASPSAGGAFTAVDSVTRDSNGHVTKVNTKTITLPNTSVAVDSALSSTSTNPVQNKVVNNSLSVIGKCKNLLNPTKETGTTHGVTVTNNGDGTYTLNGTCTKKWWLSFGKPTLKAGVYKVVGITNTDKEQLTNFALVINGVTIYCDDAGSVTEGTGDVGVSMVEGNTYENVLVKPMLTTDLSATYDDFVPYTGDGDTLMHDVAELKNDIDGKADSSHTHTKSQITDFPTSLPANGGNADTLDGYHASDFVKFKSITQAEYDKLTSPESNVIYFITDAS